MPGFALLWNDVVTVTPDVEKPLTVTPFDAVVPLKDTVVGTVTVSPAFAVTVGKVKTT